MNKLIKILSLVGIIFGVVTIISGGLVLFGRNPGYVVFLPLVIYNTAMGIVYIVAGVVTLRNTVLGKNLAGTIFFLNLMAIIIIVFLYLGGSAIAIQSFAAMSFRSVVWLVIYLGLKRVIHKRSH